jgi:hypothetical protein
MSPTLNIRSGLWRSGGTKTFFFPGAGEWSEAPACTQRTGACFHAALGGWGAGGGAALLARYIGRRDSFARDGRLRIRRRSLLFRQEVDEALNERAIDGRSERLLRFPFPRAVESTGTEAGKYYVSLCQLQTWRGTCHGRQWANRVGSTMSAPSPLLLRSLRNWCAATLRTPPFG